MDETKKKLVVLAITLVVLISFYLLAQNISPESLERIGGTLPLPIFTLLIAIVDGFNPCNLFILTLLLSLILTEQGSRKKVFAVGFTFILVVYIFYFVFMAAWLNIFKYIGFINPLRITIGIIALVAGIINCKELFFYRKGITLMVQERHVGPLKKRINNLSKMAGTASLPALIGASIVLAIFSSLVELPCTAGFPIIYTGILSGTYLSSSFSYYAYLLFYNLIYVAPLIITITVLANTFKGKPISKETMALIKFIGGAIMVLLGIILLANPGLIGLG